jgi:hypothetical protein
MERDNEPLIWLRNKDGNSSWDPTVRQIQNGRTMGNMVPLNCFLCRKYLKENGKTAYKQHTIQLRFVAGNVTCHFANEIDWDKKVEQAHAAMLIFAPMNHQFCAMICSNQRQNFRKRSKCIYTQGGVVGQGWNCS